MRDYTSCTIDEVLALIRQGESEAYGELFKRIRPIILNEAEMYRDKMVTFGLDDLVQEGNILAWQLVGKNRHESGKFLGYFKVAARYHFAEIYRSYCRSNPTVISEQADIEGMGYNIVRLGEADYLKARRAKEREYSRNYYARRRKKECEEKGIPFEEVRERRSPEEQAAVRKEQARAYYLAHKEELNRKRTEKRREKRAAEQEAAMKESEELLAAKK